jgi:hypothetical protein
MNNTWFSLIRGSNFNKITTGEFFDPGVITKKVFGGAEKCVFFIEGGKA